MSESFGRYELIEQIGTGGMAEVYLAKSVGAEGLEKELVIKKILPEYAENDRFVEMFISEADIAVGLNHPNIVQIYDFGKVDDDYYLAMEFVDGPDLRELLKAGRRAGELLPVGDSVYIAAEVAKGLHYAHQRTDQYGDPLGIVHQDVSPQNVLVSGDGAVKIVDFGIARATNAAEPESDVVKGKYKYMSPEQASGEAIDHRSDLFSLGVVLFEMVCGRPLFDQSTTEETLSLVKSAVVPDISSLNRDVPEHLEEILYRVLEQDPDDRYQTAREFQVELTKVLYDLGEIHDSMTLSRRIADLSEYLEEDVDAETSTGTERTSVLNTVTRAPADPGTQEVEVSEPADTVFEEEETSVEPFPPAAAARQRKEAVFIQGELSGLLELKDEIDEHRTWIQVLEEYTRIVDSITFKNDGLVHHVDESGFMILLGIPVSSENDAVRGTRVAMDLQEAISGMNLSLEAPIRLSIGIAVGEVVVEEEKEENGSRYNWSFYGTSYEYAEKLADMAMPNETLMSPMIYRRVRRNFECEGVTENRSADEDEPPSALRLLRPKSPGDRFQEVRRSYHSFYGREIPLKVLRDRFRSTILDERAHGVVLVGEQGVGKSTLTEEFLTGLDSRDVRVIRGVATPVDRDVPLGSLAALFVELMRLGDRNDLRKLRQTLETRVDALFPDVDDDERELLLHSLGSLFDVNYPSGTFSELTPEERRMRVFLSIRKVLRRFAERKPIAFVFDDAHYIDSASLEFATQFFDEDRDYPLFCVFTADVSGRHTDRREWEEFLEAEHLETERLEELPESEAKRLIRDLLRGHGVRSESLAERIYRWSGGNPMFIKQTVEVLREQGQLKDPEESPQLETVGEQPEWLPSSVEELMAAKIDRLEPAHKRVLQRVALLWSPFSGEDVELVLDDEDGPDELEALVREQFLERADLPEEQVPEEPDPEEVPFSERVYRFGNAMMREVAARTLLPEEAEALHASIAEYLEKRADDPGVADRARLARHLERAGDTDEALAYFLEAASDAREQFGASESLRLAERALELADEGTRSELDAQRIRQEALDSLGENEAAADALDRLVALVEEVGDDDERVDVLLRRTRFHADRAEFDEARAYAEDARELAESCGDDRGRAEAWYYEAGILMSEGERDAALELTDQAIAIYRSESSPEYRVGLAKCQNMKGIILRRAGDYGEALETYERALEHARAVEDGRLERFLLNNSGMALVYSGDYSEALRRFEEALEHCKRVGDRKHAGEYFINIGHVYRLLGRIEDAISMVRRGIYRGRQMEVDADVANGLITIGLCYLEKGDLDAADRSLHEGLRIADSIPEVYFAIHAMFALARVRLAAGTSDDAETALVQAEDGLQRAEDAGMKWALPYGHILMARALHAVGRRDAAVDEAEVAVDLLDGETGYNPEEVWYYYSRILPENEEYDERRREAAERARTIVEDRSARIDDPDDRESYLDRSLNRRIRNVAQIVEEE